MKTISLDNAAEVICLINGWRLGEGTSIHQTHAELTLKENLGMFNPLHNHSGRRPTTIAYSCDAILSERQLMQQSSQDSRSRTSKSMS